MTKIEKEISTPATVASETQKDVAFYTRDDLFRVLYAVSLAQGIENRGLAAIRYMDMARQERSSVNNAYLYEPINALLKITLPFRSLEIDDFAVVAALAWTDYSPPSERVTQKLWDRVERMRQSLTADQLSLLLELKERK